MKFSDVIEQACELLQRQQRLSYRSLKREFDLDEESLDDLKFELIESKRIAIDEDGKVLVWAGEHPVGSSQHSVVSSPSIASPQSLLPDAQPLTPKPPVTYTPAHLADRIRAVAVTDGERNTGGPLAGIRVIETGVLLAGPFCARLLGDFGAEVIKVEAPGEGDPMRTTGQALVDGKSLWWPSISRNKKCITLNLRAPEGQELLRQLVTRSDVLIENFRPGTFEGWGLGYDTLCQLNPGLIFARISGYGQTGPYRGKPGFAAVAEAFGGLRNLVGFPDRPPCRVGISLGDSLSGMFSALGVLMALYHRDVNGGQGQVIDMALYEAVFSLLEGTLTEYEKTGYARARTGTILPGFAPSNLYPCRGGQWLVIAANTDGLFRRLCGLMQREDLLTDPRFAKQVVRGQHREEIDEIVAAWTAEQELPDLLAQLEAATIPVGPVYSIEDIVKDPHYQARDMLLTLHDRLLGELRIPGVVPKLSETPGEVRFAGPTLGEHNVEVYGNVLGLSAGEIESLAARGVI